VVRIFKSVWPDRSGDENRPVPLRRLTSPKFSSGWRSWAETSLSVAGDACLPLEESREFFAVLLTRR
jgi:hypothetical protein